MSQEKIKQIQQLLDSAAELIYKAKELSKETSECFYFGPVYGMGGYLEDGEWLPSSQSC